MNNNEIIEMNKIEKQLEEKIKYIEGIIEQCENEIQEYKERHSEELKDPNIKIKDICVIEDYKTLQIQKQKEILAEKDKITQSREKEKEKVQIQLDKIEKTRNEMKNEKKNKLQDQLKFVQGTIEQYKKQIREYKESHPQEFKDPKTEITDIYVIGSYKALQIEKQKEKELLEEIEKLSIDNFDKKEKSLQRKMKLLNFEEDIKEAKSVNKANSKKETTTKPVIKKPVTTKPLTATKPVATKPATAEKPVTATKPLTATKPVTAKSATAEKPVTATKPVTEKPVEATREDEDKTKIKLSYSTQYNLYKIQDTENPKTTIDRDEIENISKQEIADELGIDVTELNNVDTRIYSLLSEHDKKYNTSKAKTYIKIAMEDEGVIATQDKMYYAGIEINYNLKDLYFNMYSLDERIQILDEAKILKDTGLGYVKKGILTTVFEKIDRARVSIKSAIERSRMEKLNEGQGIKKNPNVLETYKADQETKRKIEEVTRQFNSENKYKELNIEKAKEKITKYKELNIEKDR